MKWIFDIFDDSPQGIAFTMLIVTLFVTITAVVIIMFIYGIYALSHEGGVWGIVLAILLLTIFVGKRLKKSRKAHEFWFVETEKK